MANQANNSNSKSLVKDKATDLKMILAKEYQTQITNFFGDKKMALKFLSSVMSSVQKNPELLNCDRASVINSFMTMAQLELMPSDVSGEAYVIPYKAQAQFQLGYQGLVTLFYRAGVKSIIAEIVRENDKFEYTNGQVNHSPDVFSEDRGMAIGSYVIIELQAGGKIYKVMKKKDILDIGKKFSKSFNSQYSPWKEANDPELWMWKKTVLKQAAKLVPKNESIYKAIELDNQDSILSDRDNKKKPVMDLGLEDVEDEKEEEKKPEEKKLCESCEAEITKAVAAYSKGMYKKELCKDCQLQLKYSKNDTKKNEDNKVEDMSEPNEVPTEDL